MRNFSNAKTVFIGNHKWTIESTANILVEAARMEALPKPNHLEHPGRFPDIGQARNVILVDLDVESGSTAIMAISTYLTRNCFTALSKLLRSGAPRISSSFLPDESVKTRRGYPVTLYLLMRSALAGSSPLSF